MCSLPHGYAHRRVLGWRQVVASAVARDRRAEAAQAVGVPNVVFCGKYDGQNTTSGAPIGAAAETSGRIVPTPRRTLPASARTPFGCSLAAYGCSSAREKVEPGFILCERSASGSRSSRPSSERRSRCSFASGLAYAPKVKLKGDAAAWFKEGQRDGRAGKIPQLPIWQAVPPELGRAYALETETRGEPALRAMPDLTNRRRLVPMASLIAKIRGLLRIGKKP
jgi:hypothetical protein